MEGILSGPIHYVESSLGLSKIWKGFCMGTWQYKKIVDWYPFFNLISSLFLLGNIFMGLIQIEEKSEEILMFFPIWKMLFFTWIKIIWLGIIFIISSS